MIRRSLVVLAFAGVAALAQPQAPAQTPALSPEQIETLKKLLTASDTDSKNRVQPVAEKIGNIAKEIDRNVLSENPDPELDKKLRAQMLDAVLETVKIAMDVRLNSISEIAKVLTPEQKKSLLAELDKPGTNPDLAELVQKKFLSGR